MPPTRLSHEEIKAILRAADPIIAEGGRTLLAKILKGSKEKKVLEYKLDTCPSYGYFKKEKLEEVKKKINWMIRYDYLELENFGKLPLIVFTERGWLVESDQRADEFIHQWEEWLSSGKKNPDMTYLKDRNRGMILLMFEKIKASGNKDFIPYLQLWEKVDYRKVRAAIEETIRVLEEKEPFDGTWLEERNEQVRKALAGYSWFDVSL